MEFLAQLFCSLCCCCSKRNSASEPVTKHGSTSSGSIASDDVVDTLHNKKVDICIGAFNIARFGKKKLQDAFVVEKLIMIISRFDFILIQEVQDRSLKYIPGFVQQLAESSGHPYTYVVSESLGRSTYKEQYLYIYRADLFEIVDQFHYDDGSEDLKEDTYQREPFVVLVKPLRIAVETFAVIGAHIKPDAVEDELNEMIKVCEDVGKKWGNNVALVLMGDFNTGYLSKTKLEKLTLRTDPQFHWIIDNEDTTVARNSYTHDRIILKGETFIKHISTKNTQSFKFDEELHLTNEEAGQISDHYPVEFVLSAKSLQATNMNKNQVGPPTSINKTSTNILYSQHSHAVRIGAFNINRFGNKKFNDEVVVDHLLKIISRFDLILIQEVQDQKMKNIPTFVDQLNKFSRQTYDYAVSDNLGRKRHKERYLYIYRKDLFKITEHYHYDDGSEELEEDTFEREPFIILVESQKTSVPKFAVIGVRIKPTSVEEELDEMVKVYDDMVKKWNNVPTVIMGDFSAGPRVISQRKLDNLTLRTDKRFHWLLEGDTSVTKNDYTLDRIIVAGDSLKKCISQNTVQAFKFDEEYGLSTDEALRISDHYPVEFVLGKPSKDEL